MDNKAVERARLREHISPIPRPLRAHGAENSRAEELLAYPAADALDLVAHRYTRSKGCRFSDTCVHHSLSNPSREIRSGPARVLQQAMPLDLSHPRYLAPFPAASSPADKPRAVHLKLTEDVLKQLFDSAAAPPPKGAGVADQAIKINLAGPNPVRLPSSRRNHTYKGKTS